MTNYKLVWLEARKDAVYTPPLPHYQLGKGSPSPKTKKYRCMEMYDK